MWGLANRVVNTRRIGVLVHRDVSFIFLAGKQRPDYLTPARFRRENAPEMEKLFQQNVILCALLGMVNLGRIALDETNLKANFGPAVRIWVMDRVMTSEDNLEFLRSKKRRYIISTPKRQLKHSEQAMLGENWEQIRAGLEMKAWPSPDGEATFVLCHGESRSQKEQAIHERFKNRIEKGLVKIAESCRKRKQTVGKIEPGVGRSLGANTQAAGLFKVELKEDKENAGANVQKGGREMNRVRCLMKSPRYRY
jgi:hypothetical protein